MNKKLASLETSVFDAAMKTFMIPAAKELSKCFASWSKCRQEGKESNITTMLPNYPSKAKLIEEGFSSTLGIHSRAMLDVYGLMVKLSACVMERNAAETCYTVSEIQTLAVKLKEPLKEMDLQIPGDLHMIITKNEAFRTLRGSQAQEFAQRVVARLMDATGKTFTPDDNKTLEDSAATLCKVLNSAGENAISVHVSTLRMLCILDNTMRRLEARKAQLAEDNKLTSKSKCFDTTMVQLVGRSIKTAEQINPNLITEAAKWCWAQLGKEAAADTFVKSCCAKLATHGNLTGAAVKSMMDFEQENVHTLDAATKGIPTILDSDEKVQQFIEQMHSKEIVKLQKTVDECNRNAKKALESAGCLQQDHKTKLEDDAKLIRKWMFYSLVFVLVLATKNPKAKDKKNGAPIRKQINDTLENVEKLGAEMTPKLSLSSCIKQKADAILNIAK